MSLRRIFVLLGKEARLGATNFFLAYAIIFPILLSLVVALVFGDLFSGKPRLGVYVEGPSQVVQILQSKESLQVRLYDDPEALRDDVARGAIEVGLVLPADFDQALRTGQAAQIRSFRWGEAGLRDLLIIETAIGKAIAEVAELPSLVTVKPVPLGTAEVQSWSQRFLPLLVIMAVLLGGLVVPSTSLIDEKQSRTLIAVTTTPATLLEVYLAKVLLGLLVSLFTGWATLYLNNAFGGQVALLMGVLALGALASALLGALLGTIAKDMDSFIAIVKALGILLYAPGILALIPQVPAWVAKIFPTFYLMDPVVQISQKGVGLSEIAWEVALLAAFAATLLLALVYMAEREKEKVALA